jgi:hypothetical protein
MIPKQENIQFRESIPPNISCKSKDSSCYDTVDFFQPEAMKNVLAYLNRLSDYLFVVGRYCNFLINSVERKNRFSNFK